MLLSGIGRSCDAQTGQGVVGRNYAYQTTSSVSLILKDKILNPFIATGANGMMIDDYNGDNFDHSGLGFVGGGYMGAGQTNGRPIATVRYPPARRCGVRGGRKPPRKPISAPSIFPLMAVPTAIAIAFSISIRLTRIGSAGR
jgi:hypothetical protein